MPIRIAIPGVLLSLIDTYPMAKFLEEIDKTMIEKYPAICQKNVAIRLYIDKLNLNFRDTETKEYLLNTLPSSKEWNEYWEKF